MVVRKGKCGWSHFYSGRICIESAWCFTFNFSGRTTGRCRFHVSFRRTWENSAAEFYIRGVSSFKGTSTPLVLVDGIERELDLVDTEDIASFSILKDAAASAVYGVRGANGVILITTKKGQEGKPRINARAEFGFTNPTRRPSMLGSAEWAELYNEASGYSYYSPEEIQKYRDGNDSDLYPNVNWTKALFDNIAANQRVNLSVTGGGDVVKYYVAGSYYHENSIYKNAGNIYGYNSSLRYNKFNFRANVDINVTSSTLLNVNLANIYENRLDRDMAVMMMIFGVTLFLLRRMLFLFNIRMVLYLVHQLMLAKIHGIFLYILVIGNNSGIRLSL